jgi:hypothetical protein
LVNIVTSTSASYNTSSVVSSLTTRIPKFHQKLLNLYYEDRLSGVAKSDRSLVELGKRFDRHPDYVCRCLRELEQWGKLKSDPHGSSNKNRWITWEAFSELENKRSSQTSSQILAIPYIDLSEKELINSQILKHKEICEQLEDPNLETDTKLSIFLEYEQITPIEQVKIKSQFRASPIGPVRKERVLNRIIAQSKKRLIGSKRKYFSTCLAKEEKEIKDLCHIFKGKINNINLYSQL